MLTVCNPAVSAQVCSKSLNVLFRRIWNCQLPDPIVPEPATIDQREHTSTQGTSKYVAHANGLSELQTMNIAKGRLFARGRVEYSLGALVDRTLRERRREERRLAEQRGTKHRFQARSSCVNDGRNYRIARRLLSLARAQF
jgi:hypothetical protein